MQCFGKHDSSSDTCYLCVDEQFCILNSKDKNEWTKEERQALRKSMEEKELQEKKDKIKDAYKIKILFKNASAVEFSVKVEDKEELENTKYHIAKGAGTINMGDNFIRLDDVSFVSILPLEG